MRTRLLPFVIVLTACPPTGDLPEKVIFPPDTDLPADTDLPVDTDPFVADTGGPPSLGVAERITCPAYECTQYSRIRRDALASCFLVDGRWQLPEGTLLHQVCASQVGPDQRDCLVFDEVDQEVGAISFCATRPELVSCSLAMPRSCTDEPYERTMADSCCYGMVSTEASIVGSKQLRVMEELRDAHCDVAVSLQTRECCASGGANAEVVPTPVCSTVAPQPSHGEATMMIDPAVSRITLSLPFHPDITTTVQGALTGSGADGGARSGGFALADVQVGERMYRHIHAYVDGLVELDTFEPVLSFPPHAFSDLALMYEVDGVWWKARLDNASPVRGRVDFDRRTWSLRHHEGVFLPGLGELALTVELGGRFLFHPGQMR